MGMLLHDHVRDLARLEQTLPAEMRTGIDVDTLRTEQQASDYSALVVPLLRAQGTGKKKGAGQKGRQP
jgi:hypothetical protein